MILNFIKHYEFQNSNVSRQVNKKIPPKGFWVFFNKKTIDKINLPRIFHNPLVKAAL